MRATRLSIPSLFFVALSSLLSLLNPVYGQQVNITGFPQQLASATGMSLFASQILISIIFTFTWLVTINATRRGSGLIPNLIIGLGCLCFCVAIGWLNVWVLILISLVVASIWSGRITEYLGRRG